MATKLDVPKRDALMKPTLEALEALGGSASNQELHDWVADHLALPDEIRTVPHGDRGMTALQYRLYWARSYLKRVGAIDNSERGVWAITDLGRHLTEAEVAGVNGAYNWRMEPADALTRSTNRPMKLANSTRSNRTGQLACLR